LEIPKDLLNSLSGTAGFDEASFLHAHNSGEVLTSIRINPKKFNDQYFNELSIASKVPWSVNGYYLKERPSFTLDPLFHAGAYYVQEASSMFLEHVLSNATSLNAPLKILDLCAAPGGKSTLIQSLMHEDALLVSNEVIKGRVGVLCDNITRWGAANVVCTQNDARDFQKLPEFFDVILVDAPCSGSGLFRKDKDAIDEWSLQNVKLCSGRQERILADVLPALKPNGLLIYSTCSFSKEEDEDICDYVVRDHKMNSVRIDIKEEWKIVETIAELSGAYGYRFYPDKLKGEGFFMSVFRKSKDEVVVERSKAYKFTPLSLVERNAAKLFCKSDALFHLPDIKSISIIPESISLNIRLLSAALYIRKAGIKVGEVMHNELIPDHELALSNFVNEEISFIDTDKGTALEYLRKKTITLPDSPRGWVILRYAGLALGWAKILPGRMNNYFPKSWRILNK